MTDISQTVVMKFGGTSVADVEAIERVVAIVARQPGPRVVVVSALAGVTDRLLRMADLAASGSSPRVDRELRDLIARHVDVATIVKEPGRRATLIRRLHQTVDELGVVLRDIMESGNLTPQASDFVAACGELLSSRIVAAASQDAFLAGAWVDARRVVVTDASHGSALPLMDRTADQVERELNPYLIRGYIPVLGGFVGATADGVTTTIGRGGSDYSAAIVGACLHAREIQIWTDVDGMLTGDPRIVTGPRPVAHLSFDDAYELAHFGAKVLHPATIAPAVAQNIPVRVLNSRRPHVAGTLISAAASGGSQPVTALAGMRHLTVIDIDSRRTLRPHQFLKRVVDVFEQHGTAVTTMVVSDRRISVAIEGDRRLPGIVKALSDFATVTCQSEMALVCAVGGGAPADAGLCADVLGALSGVNVRMVSQPPSGRTVVVVLRQQELETAMTRLHDRFFGEEAVAPAGYGHGV